MGIGTLLFGGALLGNTIKNGIQNMGFGQRVYGYYKDGTPIYYDNKGQLRANGQVLNGGNSGILSPSEYFKLKTQLKSEIIGGKPLAEVVPHSLGCGLYEFSTGRIIHGLSKYRKWYDAPSNPCRGFSWGLGVNDHGVPITKEEYEHLRSISDAYSVNIVGTEAYERQKQKEENEKKRKSK